MERPLSIHKGDVVVIPFPFSDLSAAKKRPAVVIATPSGNDVILAQITSKQKNKNYSVELTRDSFAHGQLPMTSYVKVHRLFSADTAIILKKSGTLTKKAKRAILDKIIDMLQAE
ncbi:MAG: type II toxin-antitoxin system PemK/MazF family toxin [Nanobdellota archaeon]